MIEEFSRKWFLNIDNSVFDGWTHERIKAILSDMDLDYWCMSDEWYYGEYYTFLFIYSRSKKIRRTALLKLFPDWVIDRVAIGVNCKCARMYIWKEGIYRKRFF